MHDQNIMISDEQSGSWGIQKLLHMLRTSSEVQTAELGLCVTTELQQLGCSFLLECEKHYITPASC